MFGRSKDFRRIATRYDPFALTSPASLPMMSLPIGEAAVRSRSVAHPVMAAAEPIRVVRASPFPGR